MRQKLLITMVLLVALSMALAGGCGGSASGDGAQVVEKEAADSSSVTEEGTDASESEPDESADSAAAEQEDTDPESADSPVGTKDNPLPIGTTAQIGDWEVTLSDVTLDATELVQQANQFNDPAPEGSQYVMLTIDALYSGDESAIFEVDIFVKILGSGGNTFDSSSAFAVAPEPSMSDAGMDETFPGGSITGNIVIAVPVDQIEGATVIMESWGSDRTFYALA